MDTIYSDFAYDDAFRTMESECDDLLIPFVNYFHNEHYDSTARIVRNRNEHFLEHPDHSEDKRVTDSGFRIDFRGNGKKYHYECESGRYDDTLLIRMFEYDAQIALNHAGLGKHCIRVEMPYSGILLLRGKGGFDQAEVELVTPGGTVRYPVAVRHMSDLSLDDMFEKRLYMLLPFYIFNHESRLKEINENPEELEHFSDIYRDILARIEHEMEKERLSAFSKGVIISLIHKVAYKMTMTRENVQKRMGDIMGGRVLDLDIIRVHREGVKEGREEGRKEGAENDHSNSINKLAGHYMSENPNLDRDKAVEMARNILG